MMKYDQRILSLYAYAWNTVSNLLEYLKTGAILSPSIIFINVIEKARIFLIKLSKYSKITREL